MNAFVALRAAAALELVDDGPRDVPREVRRLAARVRQAFRELRMCSDERWTAAARAKKRSLKHVRIKKKDYY